MAYSLNENIRALRIAQGFTQVQFAKLLGVTKQCVSNWENDNVLPSIEMLIKLSEAFHVSTDYLLGIERKSIIDVSALSPEQRGHLSLIIEDFEKLNNSLSKKS